MVQNNILTIVLSTSLRRRNETAKVTMIDKAEPRDFFVGAKEIDFYEVVISRFYIQEMSSLKQLTRKLS